MDSLTLIARSGIYALMLFGIVAAVGVVTLRNIFHAALSLIAVLLTTAGIYLCLHAEFLALVQILLYVGAVMTLVIFAIMLTHRLGDKAVPQANRQLPLAIAGIVFFLIIIQRTIQNTIWPVSQKTIETTINTFDLGKALMGNFVFPFEVISVILIAAMIGAIIVAKREKE